MKKLFAAHKILSLIVAAAIIMSGIPLTAVSAAETATAGVTAADDTAIGLSGELDPDNDEPEADTGGEESEEEPEPDPVDDDVATSGVTDGGLLLDGGDATCVCTSFQSDPDCPVCKDDATQCFFYYCVCEALCGEDDINHDCPICRDDYTKCVQAVEVPELTPLATTEEFKFEVTVAAGGTFAIPVSGSSSEMSATGGNNSYYWNINWGDSETETAIGTGSISHDGIPHTYTTAGTYTITITPATPPGSTDRWLAAFGFYSGASGANLQTNKNMVTMVISPITPLMTRTEAQISGNTAMHYEWAYTFYGCTNLTMGNGFRFSEDWNNIKTVGDFFATYMFYDCSGTAFNMNTVFNLPTGITTVGDYFATGMFYNCSGAAFTMNNVFNLPTGITTVGNSFATHMFNGCSGAGFKVNNVFKFPVLTQENLDKINVFYRTFYNMGTNSTQTRTAASIINGNPFPNGNRQTFTSSACFSDLYDIHTNWGGITRAVITIDPQPQNATVTQGSISGSLTVAASATLSAVCSYQWYSNTTNSHTGGSLISGATGTSYTIPTTLTAGTYYYYCVVSATVGAVPVASDVATVTVNALTTPITAAAISVTAPVVAVAPVTTAPSGGTGYTCSAVTWTPTVTGGKFLGNTPYTATVTLTANSGYTFTGGLTTATINGNTATVTNNTGATATLSYQFGATAAATVSGISVKVQPKLIYTHGEGLLLSVMWVTLAYNDGTTFDAPRSSFGPLGITTSPADSFRLSHTTHDGTTITVTHTASGNTAQTNALTVSKATPSGTWPSVSATYGQSLSEISLTSYTALGGVEGTFAWTTPSDKVGNAGTQSHSMTFMPTDTANYNTATQNVSVTVGKKQLTPTINLTGAANKTYNGTAVVGGSPAISLSGAVGGEAPAATATFAFADANVGTNKTVSATGIALSGTWGDNYELSDTSLSGIASSIGITAKSISIDTVAALTKTYDGGASATAGAVTFTGTVDALTAGTDYTVTAVFTGGDYNVGGSKPYTYTVAMQSTTAANNYSLTGNTKTGSDGTINKATTGLSATTPSAITILSTDTTSRTFDLDSIVLDKTDCGTRSYTLGTFSNTGSVLAASPSLGSTNNATLTYQGGGQTSGSATQSITIKTANYTDITVTITFTATAKTDVSGSITFADSSATYDGTAKSHETATISGYSGGTWTYSYSGTANDSTTHGPTATAPTKAGTYTVTAKYEDASNLGTKTVNFTINARNISNATIAAIGNQTYNGGAITPTLNVSDSGATITTSDYTVAYGNNTNVGTATVTLTGQNNYTGTKTSNFNIVAIQLTSAAITVTAPAKNVAPNTTASGTGNFTISTVSWNPSNNPFHGGTQYTATVTLTANNGYTFTGLTAATINGQTATVTDNTGSAVTLSYQFAATDAATVSSISVNTPPKLVYVAGDKLDLSALVVTVAYDDTTTEDIAYNNAGLTYNIDGTTVTSGTTALTNSVHDGKTIEITYSGKTADTTALTVYTPLSAHITVSDITSTSAKLTYSATTDSRNTSNLTSKLQVKSGGVWNDVATTSPHTASGLAPDTTYEYQIWAQDTTTNKDLTKTVTFKTAATAPPAGVTVGGTVTDGSNPQNITVTIERGNTVIASAIVAGSGTYAFSFSNIPNGIYNLVADNGSYKVTQAVTVSSVDVTQDISMDAGKTQSVIEIKTADTPPAAVNGLPDLFSDPIIYTSVDEAVVTANGTVEIKLLVEKKDNPTDANVITDAASGQSIGLYVDLSVIKSQLNEAGALLGETKLTTLNGNLITITFELPDDLKGKTNLTIYRVHGGSAEALTSTPNADGESAVISGDIVTLNVCKFSTYAIAYTPNTPNPPNPPRPSGGGSSGGGSGGGTGTATTVSTYWIEVPEAKTMAKTAKAQKLDYVRSRRAGRTGIRKNALLTLSGLRYQHDTVLGNAVQVRVYVDDPAKAAKDILVSGYVAGTRTEQTKAKFNKWFTNKLQVISMEQQGDFGMTVQIAAKVDLSGMDTNNLYFYSYDKKANKYSRIQTEYRIDANGYLHFATMLAGDMIVSDGALTKKTEKQIAADGGKYNYLGAQSIHEITNNAGGDFISGISAPAVQETPRQEAAQTPSVNGDSAPQMDTAEDSLSHMNAADAPLKLKQVVHQSGGEALVVALDAPDVVNALQDNKKPNALLIGGIAAAVLLAAMMLWAVIPRKGDVLEQDDERRVKSNSK